MEETAWRLYKTDAAALRLSETAVKSMEDIKMDEAACELCRMG